MDSKSDLKVNNLNASENIERGLSIFFTLLGSIPIILTALITGVFIVETILFFQDISIVKFLTDTQWTPLFEPPQFGIIVLINGTLLVTLIAMLIAIPLGLMAAIFLSEYASPNLRRFLKPALEALGGIPAVVYGYFALLFVTPLLKATIFPNIEPTNALSGGIMVGILITPIISSLSEDALQSIPPQLRNGAYALGFTKTEVILKILLPAAFPGIISSFTLAASRALGETMIASIAAGQLPNLTVNPLKQVETMTAFIIQVSLGTIEFGSLKFKTIFTVGAVLFFITFILNSISYWLQRQNQKQSSNLIIPNTAIVNPSIINPFNSPDNFLEPITTSPKKIPKLSLNFKPSRFWFDQIFQIFSILAAFSGIVILLFLLSDLGISGFSRLNWDFITSFASRKPEESGILAPLIGSFWLFILTGLIVFPIGVGSAIYLEEYCNDNWFNRFLEVIIANLTAVPSILYGLLGLEIFVRFLKQFTGGYSLISGSLTLALVILPTLILASRTALRTAPSRLRQGGYAMGMSHWQVLYYIIIPSALPGILTGSLLSVSRGIGQTAALIAVGSAASIRFLPDGLQSEYTALPVQIFYWLQNPQEEVQANAAAATIVLVIILLLLNVTAMIIRDIYQRKLRM